MGAQTGAMRCMRSTRRNIMGQGTVGLEFSEQAPDIDTLLVSSAARPGRGIAAWYAGRIKVIGVEPLARRR